MGLEIVRMSKKDNKRKYRDRQRSGKVLRNTFFFPVQFMYNFPYNVHSS